MVSNAEALFLITGRIDHLYQDPHEKNVKYFLHHGDLTDSTNIIRIIQEVQPDEIYNLGAMSHVKVSFDTPEYTANTDGLGTLRILEAVRLLGLAKKTRIYQASSSELYGMVRETPQTEKTSLLSPLSLCSSKSVCILDNGKLP
jgi:GDPmannose 4,6-dehydratase